MGLDRISTFALHQSTLRDASRTQAELARLQAQLSSGLKSPDFTGIASRAEQFLSLENKISRSSQYVENNKLLQTRIDSTNNALDQVIGTANDLKNVILQRRNIANGSAGAVFTQHLQTSWRSLVQALNINLEGRFLFSGDRTDTPAVNSEQFPVSVNPGVPDEGYYQGGNQDVSAQADDNINITYNVRANAPAFQKIFAGLAAAKRADEQNSDAGLQRAYDLVQSGLTDVIAIQSGVNTNKVELDQISERQQGLQLYWKGIKEEIGNADLVSASTQVAVNQGILTASFQTFARINSLRLSDFLR